MSYRRHFCSKSLTYLSRASFFPVSSPRLTPSTFLTHPKHQLPQTLRIVALADTLLRLVVPYVARSLFKDDRITFGMHVARHLKKELSKQANLRRLLHRRLMLRER